MVGLTDRPGLVIHVAVYRGRKASSTLSGRTLRYLDTNKKYWRGLKKLYLLNNQQGYVTFGLGNKFLPFCFLKFNFCISTLLFVISSIYIHISSI